MCIPRSPTHKEVYELAQAQVRRFGLSLEEAIAVVKSFANVAVFDDYQTDSPGYAGPVMLVVWDAGPSDYEAYIYDEHGQLEYLAKSL